MLSFLRLSLIFSVYRLGTDSPRSLRRSSHLFDCDPTVKNLVRNLGDHLSIKWRPNNVKGLFCKFRTTSQLYREYLLDETRCHWKWKRCCTLQSLMCMCTSFCELWTPNGKHRTTLCGSLSTTNISGMKQDIVERKTVFKQQSVLERRETSRLVSDSVLPRLHH